MKKIISTENAPKAIGPYSQAVKAGGMVFCSGQIPTVDPVTDQLASTDIREQTEQVIRNLEAVLEAAGANLTDVVKTTVYLIDMNDFKAMNGVYAKFFRENQPARATIQAARLPKDALVEIDLIAIAGN